MTPYTSKLFSFDVNTKSIIADMSSLAAIGCEGHISKSELAIKSTRTGKTASFKLAQCHVTNGETTHLTFKPDEWTCEFIPALVGWDLTLFND